METLTLFEPFTVQIEKINSVVRYVDEGCDSIKTINDVGDKPSGNLILKPVPLSGAMNPISLIRDSKDLNYNLGLYHALSLLNSHSLPKELREFKILFPGTLRIAAEKAFIPVLFFSKDINARWRTSGHWLDDLIGKNHVVLYYKAVA